MDRLTPLDDKLKSLIAELSLMAGNADDPSVLLVDPKLKEFTTDLFNEIEKAIRVQRNKRGTKTAIMFWGTVMEAIDQIKRKAVD